MREGDAKRYGERMVIVGGGEENIGSSAKGKKRDVVEEAPTQQERR